jgi:hypothetical protein
MTASTEASPAVAGRPAAPAPVKVLFLMGSGHSGSTILGVTLGNCDGFFFAGELDNWLVRKGASLLGGTERTRFWNEVRDGVDGADGAFGADAQRYLERSSAILRPRGAARRERLRRSWGPVTESLYRSIARTAGATHIVDSAHFPLRARELARLEGIELYLLFLVRDPQQVVSSFVKHVNRHAVAERRWRTLVTNMDMSLTYLLGTLVFLGHPRERRALLRHEDFLEDPEGVLRAIFALTGSPSRPPDLTRLKTGFPMQANRLIKSEMVSFRGKPGPPPRRSRLTELVQAPWQILFSLLRPRMMPIEPARGQNGR